MRAALLVGLFLLTPSAQALDVPPLTGRVVDLGGVLDDATEATLIARLAAHEDSTSNQIVVLTIPSLGGEILEAYATQVFRTWGLGQADRDNGVLLLVAVADRELRIEVGYGLEGALTDATAGSIIRNEIVPRFRDADFDGGVLAGVDAILRAVDGEYEATVEGEQEGLIVSAVLLIILFLASVVPMIRGGDVGTAGDTKATVVGVLIGIPIAFMVWRTTGVGLVLALVIPFVLAGLLVFLNRWLERHPTWGPKRRHFRKKQAAFARARSRGATTVVVDGQSYSVPTASSSSGGGFSGGGGSSGGGGASGGW